MAAVFVLLLARAGLHNAGPGRGPTIEHDPAESLSAVMQHLNPHSVASDPLAALDAANAAAAAANAAAHAAARAAAEADAAASVAAYAALGRQTHPDVGSNLCASTSLKLNDMEDARVAAVKPSSANNLAVEAAVAPVQLEGGAGGLEVAKPALTMEDRTREFPAGLPLLAEAAVAPVQVENGVDGLTAVKPPLTLEDKRRERAAELALAVEAAVAPVLVQVGAGGFKVDKPGLTVEDKARERAAELAMHAAMHQQMRRATQVAAERLASEVQHQAPLLPSLAEPAERRAVLRERVRIMEESGLGQN